MLRPVLAKASSVAETESLSEHTIACLEVADRLLATLPISRALRARLELDLPLSVSKHDVGKAAEGMQKVMRGEADGWEHKRHEIISASFASAFGGTPPAVIFAILTHHKSIPSDGISQTYGCLRWEQIPTDHDEPPVWKEMAQEWEDNRPAFMMEWAKIERHLKRSVGDPGSLGPLALKPAWLERTSGRNGQREAIPFQDRYYASLLRGLTMTADHLGSAHVTPQPIPRLKDFVVIRKTMRPFQKRAGATTGSAILQAPTGSGKTEAALLWAQKNQRPNARLFYVLPYTASINAMHIRLSEKFGGDKVGVLHHRAASFLYSILEEDAPPLERQRKAALLARLAREMWFPIRVCTPHQILRYALRGKGWELMLAEFPNALFIIDEIDAYDPRITGLTLGLARLYSRWGAKFFFMSATLPKFLRELIADTVKGATFIEPDPAKSGDASILNKKRHRIKLVRGRITDHIGLIAAKAAKKSSTLVVCNHVSTAKEVYRLLRTKLDSVSLIHEHKDGLLLHHRGKITLLHGRFNSEDRNRIEAPIIAGKLPKVLVATQVVEVSLDIDFEQGFFEPAPIGPLKQRLGRVNRFGNRPPAEVYVFRKQANSYPIYCQCRNNVHTSTCQIMRTIKELKNLSNPVSENDLIEAADRIYAGGYQGEELSRFQEGLHHPDLEMFETRLLAGAHQNWVEETIKTTDGVIEVLPTTLVQEYEKRKDAGLWIEANSLLVSIRTRNLASLRGKIKTSREPWTIALNYTHDEGLE